MISSGLSLNADQVVSEITMPLAELVLGAKVAIGRALVDVKSVLKLIDISPGALFFVCVVQSRVCSIWKT
jgi:hypothetical protein